MRDNGERVSLARSRGVLLAKRARKRALRALGTACFALLAALTWAVSGATGLESSAVTGAGGAMLLYEDAGGYVLVGVIAFAAAVVITVACVRLREKEKRKHRKEEDTEK